MTQSALNRIHEETYQAGWLWPAVLVTLIVGVMGCATFGRINSVKCDRTANICKVESKGYLYQIESAEAPLSQITGFQAIVVRSESTRMPKRRWSLTTLSAPLYIEGKSLDRDFPKQLNVYDMFSYVDPVKEAANTLQLFLNDSTQEQVSVSFGTHRSAFVMTLLFTGIPLWWILTRGRFRLRIVVSDKVSRRSMLDDSSDSDEQMKHVGVEVSLNRNQWTFSGKLLSNSEILVAKDLVLIAPSGESEDSEIPATLPRAARDQILKVLTAERALLSGTKQQTNAQVRVLNQRQQAHSEVIQAKAQERRKGRVRFLVTTGMGLLFAAGLYGWIQHQMGDALRLSAGNEAESGADVDAAQLSDAAQQGNAAQLSDAARNGRNELDQMLSALEQKGCTMLSGPTTRWKTDSGFFEAPAGGKCIHVLAAVPPAQTLTARLTVQGTLVAEIQSKAADLQHCPTADIRHDYSLLRDSAGPITSAIVECAAPEGFHSRASGFDNVSKAMMRLEAEGCRQVLTPPAQKKGPQQMQAQVAAGRDCVNIVASTGVDGGAFAVTVSDAQATSLPEIKHTADVHIALCSQVGGAHSVQFTPQTPDYYTIGAMVCPVSVTRRLTQGFDSASPHGMSSLDHLVK